MTKFRSDVDLQKNQLQNAVLHTLTLSPSDPSEGQMYYDKGKQTAYVWNGSYWAVWGSSSPSGGSDIRQYFINLQYPRGREAFVFVRLCQDQEVLRIDAAIDTGDYIKFFILSKRSIRDSGTPLTESPITAVFDGTEETRFSNPLLYKDDWLFLTLVDQEGTVGMLTITVTCKEV